MTLWFQTLQQKLIPSIIFFTSQCSPVVNSSTLPNFFYKTQKRISDFEIKEADILLLIKNLNPNKTHGWDNVSICMIQLCGKSIVKPLKHLFESSLTAGIFPKHWKKGNIVPVHEKESKNCLKNYRPISLLPIFSKIFERLIFTALFNFSWFKISCLQTVNQILFQVILVFRNFYL